MPILEKIKCQTFPFYYSEFFWFDLMKSTLKPRPRRTERNASILDKTLLFALFCLKSSAVPYLQAYIYTKVYLSPKTWSFIAGVRFKYTSFQLNIFTMEHNSVTI